MSKELTTDQELWQEIRLDNSRAFTELYDRYWLRMYKAACYHLHDKELCEEVVQEVFVTIWKKRHSLDIINFKNYLNTCTRYEVYRKMKAAKLSIVEYFVSNTDEISTLGVEYNKGDQKMIELDNNRLLDQCLINLPKRSKEIFYMSKLKHFSNGEIAEHFGITKHTVENQLAIALRHLKSNFPNFFVLMIFTDLLQAGIIPG